MAVISLQLFTGQLIDVDPSTDFSLKSENPFFCVGITQLAHTQDFSVPATQNNNLIFNVDNSVIMEGWRRGRDCWLGYSAGEIAGRLFIKDYNKERYNLLFVWGEELDPNLSLPLNNIWEPSDTLLMRAPSPKDIPSTFGWMNYNELYNDGTFTNGITMMPAVNLGWMMEKAANAAGYGIKINDDLPSNAPEAFNPYNYGVTLDSVNAGTDYSLVLSGWSAAALPEALNYQFYDALNNPVPDNAAGVQLSQKLLFWLVPGWGQYFVFEAIRPITIVIPASNNVAVRVNSGGYPGTTDPYNEPWIHHNVRLELNAGEYFTIFYTLDYQYDGIYGSTPFNFTMSVIDSVTEAQVGDTIRLADNLPDMSLLDLIRNYCLITSSYYIIDGVSKILIYNINDVVANKFKRGRVINIDTDCDILDVASLRRYIEGYSQNNIIRCDSADYVAEIMRYKASYRVDNDLLDNESEFGVIGFNEGNRTAAGEAVFQNVEIGENNNVSLRPKLGICYDNFDGGTSYHLGWVEENFGMHNSMGLITENSTSLIMTIRESLAEYLKRSAEDLYYYSGCAFLSKDSTWKDNATQMTLVKVDNAMALAFTPIDYLRFTGNGTIYLRTKLNLDIEISQDGENFNPWAYEDFGGYRYYYTLTISDGQTYYMRGNNPAGLANASNFSQFFMSGSIYAAGDVGTLINRTGGENLTVPDYAFKMLFDGCASLLSAPLMPAKVLGESCYRAMYAGTGIVNSPVLPAKSLATSCYYGMFQNSANLISVTTLAETWNTADAQNWLAGVANGGVLTKKTETSIPSGSSGVPYTWTTNNI